MKMRKVRFVLLFKFKIFEKGSQFQTAIITSVESEHTDFVGFACTYYLN